MNRATRAIRAWLELCRVSNLPTCFTNALVGAAIGAGKGPLPWTDWAGAGAGVGLMYVAGMALNDAIDAPRDRAERPGRPIPSGRISRGAAFVFGGSALLAGVALLAAIAPRAGAVALALAAAIVLYDLLHERHAAAALLMGACRALVYPIGAAAAGAGAGGASLAAAGLTMGLYVFALTLAARREHLARPPAGPPADLALPFVALLPVLVIRPEGILLPILAGSAAVLSILRGSFLLRARGAARPAVMAWLAGICLVDGWMLALLDAPGPAAVAGACFALTAAAHRLVAGT